MHTRYLQRTILAALCLLFTILSPLGNANTLYAVSLDTSGLVDDAAGPFTLDFILRDGSGTGDANNTIHLIDFNFGEGSFTLPDPISHSKTQEVLFPQLNKLSFQIDTTNNPASPESDSFIFKILDKDGNPIPTTDPTMNNSFLTIVLYPAPGAVSTYGTPDGTVGAPTVQLLSPTNVPEPPTSLLLAIGLGGLLATWRSLRFG